MARQERQFQKREPGDSWQHDPEQQRFTESFRPFAGGVPNNPDNFKSYSGELSGARYTRRNPYGDAAQEAAPEEPIVTRANQWAGRDAKAQPDMDPRVFEVQQGPGFGFGDQSPLNRNTPFTGSYAASAGRKGTDFGSGKRNAPPPKA
jgi:hypothetical protein